MERLRFASSQPRDRGWVLGVWPSIALALAFALSRGDVGSWEPSEGTRVPPFAQTAEQELGGPVWSVAFSSDRNSFASATIPGEVWLTDRASGQSVCLQRSGVQSARRIVFSPDGRILAVSGAGPTVRLWDVETKTELRAVETKGERIRSIAFSPDGSTLAVGTVAEAPQFGTITLWDWAGHRRLAVLGTFHGTIQSLVFSGDGAVLVSGDSKGRLRFWDVADRRERACLQAQQPDQGQMSLTLSPDGNTLATSTHLEGIVRLWDIARAELLGAWKASPCGVSDMAFSPDGTILATAQGDGKAVLHETFSGRTLGSVRAQGRSLWSVAFSPDAQTLATGGADNCVRFWDLAKAISRGASEGG